MYLSFTTMKARCPKEIPIALETRHFFTFFFFCLFLVLGLDKFSTELHPHQAGTAILFSFFAQVKPSPDPLSLWGSGGGLGVSLIPTENI